MPAEPARRAERPSDRQLGWVAVLAGTAAAFALQIVNPVGVPLYDGVAVQEPYRYLRPTGDQPGSPTSFSATVPVTGTESPQITAATLENPTQAQMVALPGAFALTPDVTAFSVSVAPVDPPPSAAGGEIAGNVYRFSIVDQNGTPVMVRACENCVTLVIRAPEDLTGDARLQRYADGAWTDVETIHAGIVGMYAANPSALGDYAIVTGGSAGEGGGEQPAGGPALESYIVVGGAALILVLLFVAAFVLRRGPSPVATPPSRSRSIPSKRRRPRRPPSGGSDS